MKSSYVSITTLEGERFSAYLARPDMPLGPTILVLQEIFGVTSNIRAIAGDFAAAGYIAIAPDLFWRQQPNVDLDPASEEGRALATKLYKGLNEELALSDALLALRYASSLPDADGRTAAVGYCLGGKIAYLLSTRGATEVAVSYYGVGIHAALGEMPHVSGKLLLQIAANDHLCPPEAQASLAVSAAKCADRVQILTHVGVGHAFARRESSVFDAKASADADAATFQVMKEAFSL